MATPAYNCVFGWPLRHIASSLYTPTFSGGVWSTALPLTNLSDRRIQKVARSTNALAASTQVETDLKVARDIRVLSVLVPNATSAATVRFRGGSVAGLGSGVVYDSGTVAVLPAGFTAETLAGMNVWKTVVPTTAQTARYWLTEIVDTANPSGYIDLKVVIADGWQPTINMEYGAQLGLETETVRDITDGGAAVFNTKPVRRNLKFTIGMIPEAEALGSAFDMQRIAGMSGQIHFVFAGDDTTHMHRRAFLATLRQLTALEYPYYGVNSIPFELVEEL